MASGAAFAVRISSPTTSATAGSSPVDNTANVTTSNDGSDSASDSIVVLKAASDISRHAHNSSASSGYNIRFTITVTNNGAGVAHSVCVNAPLTTDPGTSWSIDGGSGAAICSISAVFFLMIRRPPRSTPFPYTTLFRSTTSATAGSSPVDNTANVTTSNDGSDSASDSIVVLGAAIDIAKVADNSPVSAGAPIGFTITVTKKGAGWAKCG